jgi:hypothetical protein
MSEQNRRSNIQDTVEKSMDIFYKVEKNRKLSYLDFLYFQARQINKWWWLTQFVLLAACILFAHLCIDTYTFQRSMGIFASLFIVFILPELWKDRRTGSSELESTMYYSLHSIYSARLVLFSLLDAILLIPFSFILILTGKVNGFQLTAQFFVPLVITAALCFSMLCSTRIYHETIATVLCLSFSALWWLLTMNSRIFNSLYAPAWLAILTVSLIFLIWSVYRTIKTADIHF